MKIKTYRAATIKEALAEVKKELGPEAFILSQKDIQPKKVFGVFGKSYVEVTAAVDYTQDGSSPPSMPKSSRASDSGDRVTLGQSSSPCLRRLTPTSRPAMANTLCWRKSANCAQSFNR